MKKINTFSSIDGRKLLVEIFRELRYEKQRSALSTLAICWPICTYEKNIRRYVQKDVEIMHTLGLFSGSALWMEEILNRFYFSTINSFVYFGAAILLVLIGVRRFSEVVTNDIVIAGIGFEALMLVLMFIVMLFTPNEDISFQGNGDNNETGELLTEIGEISRDFAAVILQLEELGKTLSEMTDSQKKMIQSIDDIAKINANAVSPNPEMLEAMKQTNLALNDFKTAIVSLSESVKTLNKEEIEFSVRKEVERFLVNQVRQP